MGMFDYFECDIPLPESQWQGHKFQTKDLACTCTYYRLLNHGELVFDETEYSGPANSKEEGDPNPVWVHFPFDGVLDFRGYDPVKGEIGFEVTVVNGRVVGAIRVSMFLEKRISTSRDNAPLGSTIERRTFVTYDALGQESFHETYDRVVPSRASHVR